MLSPDGVPYTADLYEEGRGMPRTEDFLHLGGPYDGALLPVVVDDDGVPVDSYFFQDMTGRDTSRDPSTELQSDELQSLYERDTRFGDDGFEYVFLFRGQDVLRSAA